MARIRTFTQTSSDSSPHPTETDAQWSVLQAGGIRWLQISTYGSDARMSKPKVSQTIQLDRERAALLKEAIEVAFPGI
ncbi:hypothetical protein SAMN04489812_2567 [Microlunatus soli]|uniref:Uncharacterized protein n=1 Tax=Microlunatus soli TaxID=630515 RepID=A0A1H1TY89_9ACTN|nr:hypothetical protein SAMN04489812_2567 [Microlunatus soli]